MWFSFWRSVGSAHAKLGSAIGAGVVSTFRLVYSIRLQENEDFVIMTTSRDHSCFLASRMSFLAEDLSTVDKQTGLDGRMLGKHPVVFTDNKQSLHGLLQAGNEGCCCWFCFIYYHYYFFKVKHKAYTITLYICNG